MKKLSCLLIVLTLFCALTLAPVSAKEMSDVNLVHISTEYLADGSYFVTELQTWISTRSSTTSSKSSTYYNSAGTAQWQITVRGSFVYNGYSSFATSSSHSVNRYVTGSIVSAGSSYSGSSATAYATVNCAGRSTNRTVTLRCDKFGKFS